MAEGKGTEGPVLDEAIGHFADRLKFVIGDESVLSFAKRAGVSEGTIRNLLRGGIPRLDSLLSIAKAGDVSVAWLAADEGAESVTEPTGQPASKADYEGEERREGQERRSGTERRLSVVPEYPDTAGLVAQGKQWYEAVQSMDEAECQAILTLVFGREIAGFIEDSQYEQIIGNPKYAKRRPAQERVPPGIKKNR